MASYLYYLICIIFLFSCGDGKSKQQEKSVVTLHRTPPEKTKQVNSIKIISPEKNKLYTYHEKVPVRFSSKDHYSIDSAVIYVNGKPVAHTGKEVCEYTYKIPADKVGTTTIKVIAWHPDGKQGIASTQIQVKPDQAPVSRQYEIVHVYPHDPEAYTQGLQYQDGSMYEGTGQYGESSLRKTDMSNGKIISVLNIDSQLFGEGITIYGDKIYQITWRSRKGFIYNLKTFSLESTFQYNSEGWGITTAGDKLIMSDGSHKLYHIAPSGFHILKEVEVFDHTGPVEQLNELEYVEGLVWANVWQTDRIVAIDPETGAVKEDIHLDSLLTPAEKSKLTDHDDVLNGIAWNPQKKTFYVTGKRWPKLFEIKMK